MEGWWRLVSCAPAQPQPRPRTAGVVEVMHALHAQPRPGRAWGGVVEVWQVARNLNHVRVGGGSSTLSPVRQLSSTTSAVFGGGRGSWPAATAPGTPSKA